MEEKDVTILFVCFKRFVQINPLGDGDTHSRMCVIRRVCFDYVPVTRLPFILLLMFEGSVHSQFVPPRGVLNLSPGGVDLLPGSITHPLARKLIFQFLCLYSQKRALCCRLWRHRGWVDRIKSQLSSCTYSNASEASLLTVSRALFSLRCFDFRSLSVMILILCCSLHHEHVI